MDDAARRKELRRIARRLHPDLGGDPDLYLAAVARLERETAGVPPMAGHPVRVRSVGGLRALVLRVRRRWRRWTRGRSAHKRRLAEERLTHRGDPRRRPGSRGSRPDPDAAG